MEIEVLQQPMNGMIRVNVEIYEQIDELGHSITTNVWVPDTDSRSGLSLAARQKSLELLKKACSELEKSISES